MRIMNDENSDNDTGATIMAKHENEFSQMSSFGNNHDHSKSTPKPLGNRPPQSVPCLRFRCLYKRPDRT